MNITTTAQSSDTSPQLATFVRSRLINAFKRIDMDIIAIDVFMKDLNGPKGGVDKLVLIRVQLPKRQVVTIESQHENMYAAISNGTKRARHAVRRQLRKSRQIEKRRITAYQYG